METDFDVVVIGAGISGLVAAHDLLLLNPDCRLLVLEAKDRVGGRTLMAPMKAAGGDTVNFDLGGMWVGPSQKYICELVQQLDIDLYPQYLAGKKFAEMGTKVAEYSGEIPYIGLLGLLDMGKIVLQVERQASQVSADNPGACRNAVYLDTISGQALLNRISWHSDSRRLLETAARTIWGADLSRMSALYMLAYANAAGNFDNLVASSQTSGQGFKMKGGAHQVSLRLAEKLGEERLRLSAPVVRIDQGDCVTIHVSGSSQPITARAVVSTVPPHLLSNIEFHPSLPSRKASLLASSPVGHLFKFIATYETAFWRELGYSGEIASADGPPTAAGCSMAPISVCFDYSVNDDAHPALVVLSGGTQAQELDGLSPQQRRKAVLDHLARFFPSEKVHACVDFAEKNWREEPFNGGCPVGVVATGAARLMGPDMREAFGRVYFAGTETATEWYGYMDGAVQSGKRAAKEVHDLLSNEKAS